MNRLTTAFSLLLLAIVGCAHAGQAAPTRPQSASPHAATTQTAEGSALPSPPTASQAVSPSVPPAPKPANKPPLKLARGAKARLLWVSIDGLSWSRLRRSKLPLPHLRKLITHGVSGPLLSVYPSQTWPAHASLLTGSWPARHGVVGNHLWSRKRRKVVHAWQLPQGELMKGDTLFDASNRQGVKTANVFWPNTARAKGLNWNLPEVYGWSAFHRWASPGVLKELQRAGLPSDRITRISHEESFEFDSFATDAALHVMKRHRPGLLMVHLLSVDMLSHRYGPDSRPADWALALCDRYLGQLLAGWREAGGGGVVIVSDHGFTQVTDGIGHRLVLRAAKLTKRERAAVHVVANGHNLYLYADPTAHGTAGLARLRDHLRKDKRLDVWQTAAQMKALHLGDPGKLPWLPDAIAMMKPGVLIWGTRSARRERKPVWRGNHGHLPETPGLDGAFIASGPGFRPGTHIDQLRAVDVAPTLARHYGWPLRGTHDGQVRSEMLSSRAVATRR